MLNGNVVELSLPRSLFDTDLYKFTMQQAVLQYFSNTVATYKFTHRDKDKFFTRECIDQFTNAIPHFSSLGVSEEQLNWLQNKCPFFTPEYLDYLRHFRFKPKQVSVQFIPEPDDSERGQVEITAIGPWHETILWEVPLMACLSELYFRIADTDWSDEDQEDIGYSKIKTLLEADIKFSEFGTRRRRSYAVQDTVVRVCIKASKEVPTGQLVGTSNVHLAHLYDLTPIGTIAHEWYMGIGALTGYEGANGRALDMWEKVYPGGPLITLTDTFSSEVFYKDFVKNKARAERWVSLRQDSGDPFVFAPRVKEICECINIAPKPIIFSDAINLDKALRIKKQCDELGIKSSFGIGTFLTNDFKSLSSGGKEQSRALNMVIKLANVDGKPCVKISDELTKNTGEADAVRSVKELYGIQSAS